MKKTLLMLVAFMATMTAFAQDEQEGWEKSFTPVASASDLAGMCTAVAADGAVYASSTYDQAFQFAGKNVKDPEGLLSSCVLKYDKDGNELWSVSLIGKCEIHAMTADTDGTLYIAGTSEDVTVKVTGTDDNTKEIVNPSADPYDSGVLSPTVFSAFIVKITKEGVVENTTQLTPGTNAEVAASEFPFYMEDWDPLTVSPRGIVICGDKVYVSAAYKGDVKVGDNIIWQGAYVLAYDGMVFADNRSYGIASFSKADLTNAENAAYIQMKDNKTGEIQNYPEGIGIANNNGKVYASFLGWGNLNIIGATTKSIEFSLIPGATSEDNPTIEHGFVLVDLADIENAQIYHAEGNTNSYPTYDVADMAFQDGACIIGGTFYGNLPLKTEITKNVNTSFVASIQMADYSVKWATPNEVESYATCMIVTGEEIHASTDAATFTFKTATGEVKADKTRNQSYADADVYNDQYASTIYKKDATVYVFSPKMSPSGIEAIKAAAAQGEAKIYNLNGQRVATPQKGLYIVNGKKAVIK